MTMLRSRLLQTLPLALVLALMTSPALAADKPLKVFILVGQSNMEGHAKVETFDFYDFGLPSAGVFPRTEADIEKDRRPKSGSGHYYRLMLKHTKR